MANSAPSPVERLQALELVEKDIYTCLQSAGQALSELSKDKPSAKHMEQHTSSFLKTLNHAEMEISKHINYLMQVSTGQPHEGSSYAAQKVLQMAWHRTEHARSRVVELQQLKMEGMRMAGQQLERAGPGGGPVPSTSQGQASNSLPVSSSTELTSIKQQQQPATPKENQ